MHLLPESMQKFIRWMNDPAFFERTRMDRGELSEAVQRFLLSCEMPDEAYDAFMAIFLALYDQHPHFKLEFSPTETGKFTIEHRYKGPKSNPELANFVEMQVALGMKQESAIAEAIERYNVSRRTILRILKHERDKRSVYLALGHSDDAPEGFSTTEDGRLKQSDK